MNTLTLPLLGALSSTESGQDTTLEGAVGKVRKSIANMEKELRASRFVAKSRLERALERCINDTETLCVLPQLLGHACIGIVEGAMPLWILLPALGEECAALASQPLLLPRLLFPPEKAARAIRALSLDGKIINFSELDGHPADMAEALTPEEYETLMGLTEDGIHPRDVISALLHFTPLRRPDSTYLLLPPEEFLRAGSGKLVAQCNTIIILGNVTPHEALEPLRNNFTMPVYIISENASDVQSLAEYLKGRYAGRQVDILPPHELENLLDALNAPVERITLHDRLLAELLQVGEDLSTKIELARDMEKALKRDSVLASQTEEALGERLEASRKAIMEEIQSLNLEKKKFSEASSAVLQAAEEVEKLLQAETPPAASPARLHAGAMRPEALWRRIILRALVAGDMDLAKKYQARFEALYPDQAFLTSLYYRKKKGRPISADELNRLRFMPDSPETLRAKIYFRRELDLTEQDCVNIVKILPRQKDAAEKYYFAWHLYQVYQENKHSGTSESPTFQDVIDAFRAAVLAGSAEAAELFASFCGGEGWYDEAKEIADMGNPTGAYIFRLLASSRQDSHLAHRYLKIASALGHPEALAQYAEKYWENRLDGENVHYDSASRSFAGLNPATYKNGIDLYEYLLTQPELAQKIPALGERLGYFYFCNHEWQRSRQHIGADPTTAEGCFCLSVMLKYGLGGDANKKEAIRIIRIAEGLEDPFKTLARTVKLQWMQEDIAAHI